MKLILLYFKQGRHATNDASIVCSNVGVGCGVAGGSGDVGGSNGGVGGVSIGQGGGGGGGNGGDCSSAARGPQGIWMQYFPLERLNSPCGGGGGVGGDGDGGNSV